MTFFFFKSSHNVQVRNASYILFVYTDPLHDMEVDSKQIHFHQKFGVKYLTPIFSRVQKVTIFTHAVNQTDLFCVNRINRC